MTVIPAPLSRIFALVVAGLVLVAVGAVVVAQVAPTKLLLSTALMVVLVKGQIVERTRQELGPVAAVAVVLGSAWGFGAWVSLDDFALWPGLVASGVAVLAVLGMVPLLGAGAVRWLALRLTPLSAVMAVAMALSWFVVKQGALGVVVGALFVVWSLLSLVLQVGALDEHDEPIGAAANIVDDIGFVCWNCFVLVARLHDDDGAATILWW